MELYSLLTQACTTQSWSRQMHLACGDVGHGVATSAMGPAIHWETDCSERTPSSNYCSSNLGARVGRQVGVVSNCDNQAVVAVLNSQYSREKDLMQLLRCLFFLEAHFQFQLSAYHLPGILNDSADDLSRNHLSSFQTKMPMADTYHSSIPPSLLQWLLHPAVQFFCKKGIADSTHKTYQSAL